MALDVSLRSTGIAYRNREHSYAPKEEPEFYVSRIVPKSMLGMERISFVTEVIRGTVFKQMSTCDLICMEGPAFGMKQNNTHSHSLGELHGAIRFFAYREGIAILTVPPSNLKKFVTGRGNADKDEVIAGVRETWGYETPHHDEADAEEIR